MTDLKIQINSKNTPLFTQTPFNNVHTQSVSNAIKSLFLIIFASVFANANAFEVSKLNEQLNSNNQRWQLSWADEFEGEELSIRNWNTQFNCDTTEQDNTKCSNQSDDIFVDSGLLHLVLNPEVIRNKQAKSTLKQEEKIKKLSDLMEQLQLNKNTPWQYGRFEMRAKLFRKHPSLQLSSVFETSIDSANHQTNGILATKNLTQFHTYAFELTESHINWYIDGVNFSSQPTAQWKESEKPFSPLTLLIDLAINGVLFDVTDATKEPRYAIHDAVHIEYFRVYKCINGTNTLGCGSHVKNRSQFARLSREN